MSNITKMALAVSLCELLETKPLEKITISDITGRCGLTRNTFYYHFHDIYELLDEVFTYKTDTIISKYEHNKNWRGGYLEALNFLYERRGMVNQIFRSSDHKRLDSYLNTMMYRHALTIVGREIRKTGYSNKVRELAVNFYKNAFTGAVIEWIEGGMRENPKKMAERNKEIFFGTVNNVFSSIDKVL